MGLDANYPAVEINDLSGLVPIYDGDHNPVDHLGDGESVRTNVTCLVRKWDNAWFYKQAYPPANVHQAYIPADDVHVIHNPNGPGPVPECKSLSGCLTKTAKGAGTIGAAAFAVRRWQKRRR